MRSRALGWSLRGLLALGLLAGCGGGGAPPPARPAPPAPAARGPAPAAPASKAPAPPQVVLPKEVELPPLPPRGYDARGRRDPFRSLVAREGQARGVVEPSELRLVGVLVSPQGPVALAETADGLGYVLRPGDVVGGATVAKVDREAMVLQLPPERGRGTLVLKLFQE